ncbi:hypothetical protein [Streptomonospora litoralis]|uniref:Uncharacterized protein n=1 Tax=Streptomonospora litoralis TaxID=2498135 RepID=A0A4P6PYC6_9ACTN|nr:hypothetical protein [Streptomonospora litoralis]QBI53286.1 hypothetical protein EKD16_07450 [Streptomonospora litoralis]
MNRPDDVGALTRSADIPYRSDFARKHYAEGEAKAILQVLDERNIEVPPGERSRILACTCEETLTSWLTRALTATSTDQLFR